MAIVNGVSVEDSLEHRSVTGSSITDDVNDDHGGSLDLTGDNHDDELHGGDHHDTLRGGNGRDDLHGGAGDDHLAGGHDNDVLHGDDGLDTADVEGRHDDYTVITNPDGSLTVSDHVSGRDGTDSLVGVERVHYSDGYLAFDTDPTDVAGSAYLIYRAAFDRAPDAAGLGYWIRELESGADFGANVASSFLASSEFAAHYGTNLSNSDFLAQIYQNVLDRTPDQAGLDYWRDQLEHGYSRGNLLASFAVSHENFTAVSPQLHDGIWFI